MIVTNATLVLKLLYEQGEHTPGQIGKTLMLGYSLSRSVLKNLWEEGMVARSSGIRWRITPKGVHHLLRNRVALQPRKTKTIRRVPVALFLRYLSSLYPNDCLNPGVVISYVDDARKDSRNENRPGRFYGSVIRYEENTRDKQVVHTAFGDSPSHVIEQLAVATLATPPADKLREELKEAMNLRRSGVEK